MTKVSAASTAVVVTFRTGDSPPRDSAFDVVTQVTKWSVDGSGVLHLYYYERQVATYAAGTWTSVSVCRDVI